MRAIVSALLVLSLAATAQVARADFRDNGDGTVTDLSSSLTWQRCSAPSKETNCGSVSPSTYAWNSALSYCNGLDLAGHTDWRLPNVKDLHSIVDATKTSSPTINVTYFPDTQAADYWSSTTLVDTPGMAWYVQFSIGLTMTSPVDKSQGLYVRCVRGG